MPSDGLRAWGKAVVADAELVARPRPMRHRDGAVVELNRAVVVGDMLGDQVGPIERKRCVALRGGDSEGRLLCAGIGGGPLRRLLPGRNRNKKASSDLKTGSSRVALPRLPMRRLRSFGSSSLTPLDGGARVLELACDERASSSSTSPRACRASFARRRHPAHRRRRARRLRSRRSRVHAVVWRRRDRPPRWPRREGCG